MEEGNGGEKGEGKMEGRRLGEGEMCYLNIKTRLNASWNEQ